MEEIYFVVSGTGQMRVDDETRQVVPGDATWIPVGSAHALLNNGAEDCVICRGIERRKIFREDFHRGDFLKRLRAQFLSCRRCDVSKLLPTTSRLFK
jgi:quercetin dioxygenase-like cupin family protein